MSGGCASDHCITCSDEGVEMRVMEAGPDALARCAAPDGGVAEVATELVGAVAAGDLLLVHAGVALAVLGRAAA